LKDQKNTENIFGRVNNGGFTLLEALFALAIFSIGILAIAGMQISSINGNSSARMQTEATTLAVERLEQLSGLPYDHADLDPNNNPHQTTSGAYAVVWNVSEDVPIALTKTINITVTAGNPSAKDVSLSFIRGQGS
jgi:prepilin-type N-terminal cleavage/methylation domain-containing protein